MSNHGFESDAAYFELAAQSADPADRRHLRQVAAAYRALAKNGKDVSSSRQEHWSHRAAQCRTFLKKFKHPECRTQLLRLAETYGLLAEACDDGPLKATSQAEQSGPGSSALSSPARARRRQPAAPSRSA
jgi:hypothetical protein